MTVTIMFAVLIPDVESEGLDPDILADEFVHMINEVRAENGTAPAVHVSLLPFPQFVTNETLRELREFIEQRRNRAL